MKNTMGRIARAAAAAGLSLALALGGVAPSAGLAAAGDLTGTGTLTLSASTGDTVTSYKAIKIFKANVFKEGTGANEQWVASDLDWESSAVKAAVIQAIRAQNSTWMQGVDDANIRAQDAADFLIANITNTDSTTMVPSDSFANTLAREIGYAVADTSNALQADYTIKPGVPTTMEEGYYLIIVDPAEVSSDNATGTSPILLMMGEDQNITMQEKASIPTVSKTVQEDASTVTTPTLYADAQVSQELPYTLTGTVAGNIESYTNYKYIFHDTLCAGLTFKQDGGTNTSAVDNGDVTVKVKTTTTDSSTTQPTSTTTTYILATGYTVGYENVMEGGVNTNKHTLTVTFADLKSTAVTGVPEGADAGTAAAAVPINATSEVTVEYKAKLNERALLGTETGNENTVTLEYSNMPNFDNTGTTTSTDAKVYTYGLKMKKVDKDHALDGVADNDVYLTGAKFTIQATNTDEGTTNNGKYLKTDGTFGKSTQPAATETDYVFTTDGTDGSFTVKGLDAGTYTIHEVAPPTGYKALTSDLVLTVTVSKHAETNLPGEVTTSVSGGEGDQNQTGGTSATYDRATGTITLTATNQKEEKLPLTGLSGITLVYVAGGAILAVSLVAIVRRRMKDQS